MNSNFTFEIKKHIGVLSEGSRGWKRELNIVSWNEGNPKLDIREWSEDHTRMSRGITLTDEEARELKELLEKIFC